MGILSGWRHHLQNEANRARIKAARTQERAARAAADAQHQHDVGVGRAIVAREDKVRTQALAEYVEELRGWVDWHTARGRGPEAELFRKAAVVAERMSPDEWEQYRAARLRHDGTTGAEALARRF